LFQNGDLYSAQYPYYVTDESDTCSYVDYQIVKVDNLGIVLKYTPKNTSYKGIIYGMVDEFENDCEYDFKNALITGEYSAFDPDQFYYTFTN
jgi:hypothetical protein